MRPIIILDEGHGGLDMGGQYTTKGKKLYHFTEHNKTIYEGHYNRLMGTQVQALFEAKGYTVVRAAHAFLDTSLAQRVRTANAINEKALYLSLHFNAYKDDLDDHLYEDPNDDSELEGLGTSAHGFEVFTYKPTGTAFTVANNIVQAVKLAYPGQVIRKNWKTGTNVKQARFYVLRYTKHPAVLVEFEFFNNWEQVETKLLSEPWRHGMAKAVVEGIDQYYSI